MTDVPAGTALFFRVLGRNKTLGDYQVYIEANFNGYEVRDFRLKKAYASINDWTFGYTNSTFSDPSAQPPTVDPSGPNSKIGATLKFSGFVGICHKIIGTHQPVAAEAAISFTSVQTAEMPSDQIETVPEQIEKVSQYIPDIAAFMQYGWGESNHIRLSAIYRSLPYRDLLMGKNHNKTGFGIQGSTIFRPFYSITVYGCLNGGKGYGSLGGDWLMGIKEV